MALIVFYIHWGEEYQLSANTWQKSIAQKLSNLGVDIIIGSHPHVVQPIELIHSEDGENTTVCLYSTGNAVSNQRQEIMDSCPSGHTEDGLFFYRKIVEESPDYLNGGGMLFFEIGYDQAEDVSRLMEESGYKDVQVKKDYAGLDRVVFGYI